MTPEQKARAEELRTEIDQVNARFVDIRHSAPGMCSQFYAWRAAAADAKTLTYFGEFGPAETMIELARC